ncbi:RhoGAP domain containing protein [Acanthamoeba castellanii str. Neff]|uniref:RhoGAP domain containing protein n=1 Tax=Acanthamoeba castellanii (strain ATCC 30010 / Neff) TaxID=1257118 RepID=L8GHU6_ACACF|nr:RhoGAP domain containing protein [Acanthamoeba castellanii str. Neff]ELR12620.1 RhoGAP domain containing protein [Acanthamoeba castellanii str. Neff]
MFSSQSPARRTITPKDVEDAVTLQVRYVKATTQDKSRVTAVRKMRFDRSWTIRKGLTMMATEGRMPHMEGKYLYQPNAVDRKVFGTWLQPDKTFADYNIKDMDEVEVKHKPQLVTFGVWSSLTDVAHCPWLLPPAFSETKIDPTVSVELDFREPLRDIVPFLPDLFGGGVIKRGEEYIFQHLWTEAGQSRRKWLNAGASLEEQDIIPGSILVLTPLGPFLKRPLTSIKNPEKSGFLMKQSIKEPGGFLVDAKTAFTGESGASKKTGTKKRWFVVEDNLLYYYASKTASTPSGVIPLDYCSISELQSPTADKYQFELIGNIECFSNKVARYLIFDDNEAQVREWMKIVRYKCANCSDKRVFEVSITKTMKHTKGDIPNIIKKTVKYIEERGMDVEGIFRKSGGMISVQKYRDLYDNGEDPDLSECVDPHTVSGLLKLYLRSLPEPLITYDLYDKFKEASELGNAVESAARMRALVNSLPQDNQVVLEYLIDFIGRVAQHSATNFMHIQNLATVFGPNLLRPKDASAIEMMGHTSTICAIVELLIGRREEIFADVKSERAARVRAATETPDHPEGLHAASDLTERKIRDFTKADNPVLAAQEELHALGLRLDELGKRMHDEKVALDRLADLTSRFMR